MLAFQVVDDTAVRGRRQGDGRAEAVGETRMRKGIPIREEEQEVAGQEEEEEGQDDKRDSNQRSGEMLT